MATNSRNGAPSRPGLGPKLALSVGVPLAVVLLLEVGARLAGVLPAATERTFGNFSFGLAWTALPEPLIFRPHPTRLYEPRPGLRGVVRTDDLGFRGPDRIDRHTNSIRIAVLGDSTTFGFGVFEGDGFVARTAAALRAHAPSRDFDLINAGCYGYTSWQNRLDLADRVLPLAPQIVVLCLSGFNDSVGALEVDDEEWSRRGAERNSPVHRLLERSRAAIALTRLLNDDPPTDPHLGAVRDQVLDGSVAHGRRVAIEKFDRNVRAIIAMIHASGAQPVLMTHAFRADAAAEDPYRASYSASLAALATELGVGFVDGAAALDHGAAAHYFDRIHPTEAGHSKLSTELTKYLLEKSTLQSCIAKLAAPSRWPRLADSPPLRVAQPNALTMKVEGDFAGDLRPRFSIGGNTAEVTSLAPDRAEIRIPALPAGEHDITLLTAFGSDVARGAVIVAPPSLSVERHAERIVVTVACGGEGATFELHVATATASRSMMLRRTFALDSATGYGPPLSGSLALDATGLARGALEIPLPRDATLPPRLHLQALVSPAVDRCRAEDRFAISYPTNVLTLDS
jgi:lysophospholipase L1-like esterase